MAGEKGLIPLMRDIRSLKKEGIKVVLIHGGGRRITELLRKAGVAPRFVGGLRVTDAAALSIVKKTLPSIGAGIAKSLRRSRIPAKALSGARGIIVARQKSKQLGYVGEITAVKAAGIMRAIKADLVPVISPLGTGRGGVAYNLNADTAAAHVAAAIKARALVCLTDQPGVMANGRTVRRLNGETASRLLKNNAADGGMTPKIKACVFAVSRGVPAAIIANGAARHPLIHALAAGKFCGTKIVY